MKYKKLQEAKQINDVHSNYAEVFLKTLKSSFVFMPTRETEPGKQISQFTVSLITENSLKIEK